MARNSPVSEADLDSQLREADLVLEGLHGLTRRVEVAGVECSAPLRRLVSLIALSEAAAGLAKAIAGRCAMAEDRRELEEVLRKK